MERTRLTPEAHRPSGRRAGLAVRLGVTHGVVVVAATLLAGVTVGALGGGHLREQAASRLQVLAHEMTDRLDRSMYERYREIQILTELDAFQRADAPAAERRRLLDRMQQTLGAYAWIGLTDPNGRVLQSTAGMLEGADVSSREWFSGGREGPFVGDVHDAKLLAKLLPSTDGEPLRFVDVSAPVLNERGQLTGVIGAHLSWAWAGEMQRSVLRPVQRHERIEVLVLSADGTVLLGPDALMGERVTDLPTAERGSFERRWPDGREALAAYSRTSGYHTYPGLGWQVLVRQDVTAAYAPVRAFQHVALLAALTLGLLAALFGWGYARRVTRPLLLLTRAASDVARHAGPVEVPLTRAYPEVEQLSATLRDLVSNLDRRVRDRTAELSARTAEAEALAGISRFSASGLDPRSAARGIGNAVAPVLNASLVALLSVERDGQLGAEGLHPTLPPVLPPELTRGHLPLVVVESGEPLYLTAGLDGVQVALLPAFGLTVLLAVRAASEGGWTSRDAQLLEAAARGISLVFERQQRLEHLEHEARHDALTGLGNRRAFEETLERVVHQTPAPPTAVMMIDVDGLKGVNDTFGHARGDALLQAFARAFGAVFRTEDQLFRLGGDEFAVILTPADPGDEEALLRRVQLAGRHVHDEGFPAATASAGVACCPTDAVTPGDLVRIADGRMYERKASRRTSRVHSGEVH